MNLAIQIDLSNLFAFVMETNTLYTKENLQGALYSHIWFFKLILTPLNETTMFMY